MLDLVNLSWFVKKIRHCVFRGLFVLVVNTKIW
jgi:hypothetical protein